MKAIFIALALVATTYAQLFITDSVSTRTYGKIDQNGDTSILFTDMPGGSKVHTFCIDLACYDPEKSHVFKRVTPDTTVEFVWAATRTSEHVVTAYGMAPITNDTARMFPLGEWNEIQFPTEARRGGFLNWNLDSRTSFTNRSKDTLVATSDLGGGDEYTKFIDSLGVVEVWTSIRYVFNGYTYAWLDDGFHHTSGSYVKPNPKLNFNPKRERVILLHVVRGTDTVYNVRKPITVVLRSESSPWNVGQAWEWIDTQNTWDPQKVQAQWIGADGKSLPTQWLWQGNKIVLQVSPGAQPSWLRLSQPGKTRVWPLRPQF